MNSNARAGLRWLAALVLLGVAAASPAAGADWKVLDQPPVRILYQPGNGTEAESIAARAPAVLAGLEKDLGLRPQGPISVRILPVREGPAPGERSEAPHWAVGYVMGGGGEVVLRGDYVRTYPFEDLLSLFTHEMTHVLLNGLPGAATLPRWFHEGVAVTASRRWSLSDSFNLGTQVIFGRPARLADLSGSFPDDAAAARAAYAESFHFVSYLEREHGPGAVRGILSWMARGDPFRGAFRKSIGGSLEETEAAWRDRVNWAYRWIPALTSSGVIWMIITFLVLLGRLAKRRRERELREAWERQGLG